MKIRAFVTPVAATSAVALAASLAGPLSACPDCETAIELAAMHSPFLGVLGGQPGGPGGPPPGLIGDPTQELKYLADRVQLTFADDWTRAGESYFDRTGRWIVFQATPQPAEGEIESPHYGMYVAKVKRDAYGNIAGLHEAIEISPPGSANTCGWFHPDTPGVLLFGSTLVPPSEDDRPGYSRDRSRYSWQFPAETEVVSITIPEIVEDMVADPKEREALLSRPDVETPTPIFSRPGYDAECSWSPDGRTILYCNVDPTTEVEDGDLYIYVVETGEHRPIMKAEGYDGGPFFSPCGRWICYRSDRRGDNLLQLFVAELSFDEDGLPDGIEREIQLTDEGHVNWAPYWSRPDGRYLIYASSEVAHYNYEVFAIEFDRETGTPGETVRVTNATGFDGLPVHSWDGRWMMWTGQRGEDRNAEGRPTSQLWAARIVKHPF